MSYRNDLDALTARHAALETEVEQKTRELEQSARLLADAKAKSKLPVLDNIRVASPCKADWSKMTGDDRARHCGDCQTTVYNISEMTRDEAEALVIAKAGKLCMRYYQRTDGTILLKDCSIGIRRKRRRRIIVAGAAAMLAGGAAVALVNHNSDEPEHGGKWADEPRMGVMVMMEPTELQHEVKGEESPRHEVELPEGVEVRMGK